MIGMSGAKMKPLYVLHTADGTEVARWNDYLPATFKVAHADGCKPRLKLGPCPCKEPAVPYAVVDENGDELWVLDEASMPTLCVNDSLVLDVELRAGDPE